MSLNQRCRYILETWSKETLIQMTIDDMNRKEKKQFIKDNE